MTPLLQRVQKWHTYTTSVILKTKEGGLYEDYTIKTGVLMDDLVAEIKRLGQNKTIENMTVEEKMEVFRDQT